jgi:hypothetical protein
VKEFDDTITQVQLVKNRLMSEGLDVQSRPLKALGAYKKLVCTTLYTILDKQALAAKIKEVYTDLLHSASEGELPSLYDIVDAIDEENTAILYTFYESTHISEDEFDNVLAHYVQDVSCMLDDWVEEVLSEYGYCFKGVSLMKMFNENHDRVNSSTDSEAQNIINPEWPI